MLFFTAAFVALLYFVPASEAAMCYQCTSTMDRNCGDPFTATNRAQQCQQGGYGQGGFQQQGGFGQGGYQQGQGGQPGYQGGNNQFGGGGGGHNQQYGGGQSMCQKISRKQNDGTYYVSRECFYGQPSYSQGSGSSSDGCVATPDGNGYQCVCHGDYCNGAATVYQRLVTPTFMLLAALFALFVAAGSTTL